MTLFQNNTWKSKLLNEIILKQKYCKIYINYNISNWIFVPINIDICDLFF